MDLYFLRMDTGYDAVMLAVMDEEGVYHVYRVNQTEESDRAHCLFIETNADKLREEVRNWCEANLPIDMKMVEVTINGDVANIETFKSVLNESNIPFERRQQTFYIRPRDYEKVADLLGLKRREMKGA